MRRRRKTSAKSRSFRAALCCIVSRLTDFISCGLQRGYQSDLLRVCGPKQTRVIAETEQRARAARWAPSTYHCGDAQRLPGPRTRVASGAQPTTCDGESRSTVKPHSASDLARMQSRSARRRGARRAGLHRAVRAGVTDRSRCRYTESAHSHCSCCCRALQARSLPTQMKRTRST